MWLTIRHFLCLAMITLNLYLLLSHILILTTSRNVTALRLRGKKSLYKEVISKPKNKQEKVIVCFLCTRQVQGEKRTTMIFLNYRKVPFSYFYSKISSL